MTINIDRYKKDLDSLMAQGKLLQNAIQFECYPEDFGAELRKVDSKRAKEILASIPSFKEEYQTWYSEVKVLLKQLLPDRLDDFVRHYEKPKTRKDISFENYKIEDYLQGLEVTRGVQKEKVVGPEAAIPQFHQQLNILKAVNHRFESSLFDIRQLVQADLFDSELDAATELLQKKFIRAAGAIAGVVLERHLSQVCDKHTIKMAKKSPHISDFNDALKNADIIDTSQWRFIQHLADIRNLCDHNKKVEPTKDQVQDLISGVTKTIKSLF